MLHIISVYFNELIVCDSVPVFDLTENPTFNFASDFDSAGKLGDMPEAPTYAMVLVTHTVNCYRQGTAQPWAMSFNIMSVYVLWK